MKLLTILLHGKGRWWLLLVLAAVVAGLAWRGGAPKDSAAPAAASAAGQPGAAALKPSLSVTSDEARREEWPLVYAVDGNVVAWQEAVIGAEIGQYRITEVSVQVGDRVRKGQVLARIAVDAIGNEVAEARAAVAELEASSAEARANAQRAQTLRAQGFYSTQMHAQFATAEQTATARLDAARARLQSAELRMRKTSVTAPDDGVISARSASVGSLTQQGQELFRLIRFGRLEWQAEAPATVLAQIKPGAVAVLSGPAGEKLPGTVRAVAPSVDPRTRNGIVYVDLPATTTLRAGMFARGEIETGRAAALTLPVSAVVLREGFAYVYLLAGEAGQTAAAADQMRVTQVRVRTGRRNAERIEIVDGLTAGARVVASGAGFLADGDVVKHVVATADGQQP